MNRGERLAVVERRKVVLQPRHVLSLRLLEVGDFSSQCLPLVAPCGFCEHTGLFLSCDLKFDGKPVNEHM